MKRSFRYTEMTEEQVTTVCTQLGELGFDCDTDFTPLYGEKWKMTGIETTDQRVADAIDEIAE